MKDDAFITKAQLSDEVRQLSGKYRCLIAVIANLVAQRAIPMAQVIITLDELKAAPDVEIVIDNQKVVISLKGENTTTA